MRDPNRIPNVLDTIRKVWSMYPDLRLGQLLANHVDTLDRLYYLEDDRLIEILKASISAANKPQHLKYNDND
jgi:hypothetical protein